MTAETPTPTREPRQSRRGIAILAGVAGGLLLLGGTTYALWTATATQAGGTIENGNLDVIAVGTPTYWDTSADRTDVDAAATPVTALDAHAIPALASYSVVPGDTLEANYGYAVALDGDNLVASIDVTLAGGSVAAGNVVTFTAQAWYLDGATWTAAGPAQAIVPGSATAIATGNFQAANQLAGTLDGSLPVIVATTTTGATTPNVTIVVTATFPAGTGARIAAELNAALGNVTVAVNQIRTAGVGNFG